MVYRYIEKGRNRIAIDDLDLDPDYTTASECVYGYIEKGRDRISIDDLDLDKDSMTAPDARAARDAPRSRRCQSEV